MRELGAISCYKLMVEGLGWHKCIDPTCMGTGSARHYAKKLLLGEERGMHHTLMEIASW